MGMGSLLDSILVDVKLCAVDMHTHGTISTYVCSMACACVFLCVALDKIFPTPFYVHIFSFSFCSIWKRGGWAVGIRFRKLARLLSLVYLSVRYDSLCSHCTQHYVCTFKMLFIYCNLVARHFVNVYDISHSSKGFEIYIHHTWCRRKHRTLTLTMTTHTVDRVLWNNISLWNAFSLNYVTIKMNICVYIRHEYVLCTHSLCTHYILTERTRRGREGIVGGSRVNNEYISFESLTNCMKIVYSVNDFALC